MKLTLVILLVTSLHFIGNRAEDRTCQSKDFGTGSVACYCDESYCDSFNPDLPACGQFMHVQSNKDGLRFSCYYGQLENFYTDIEPQCMNIIYNTSVLLKLDRTKRDQTIVGFGSTFTDATGYNLNKLSDKLQDVVIKECFGVEGLRFNMARAPIAHTDFSLSEYYYNDSPYDVNQVNWSLADADYNYKIPYIKKAMATNPDEFHLFSSIWTVPEWMREDSDDGSKTLVKSQYYDSYALYIIKYLEAYRKEGIENWGVTYVNEPTVNLGTDVDAGVKAVFTVWPLIKLIDFGINIFKPALRESGFDNVNILYLDDNRNILSSINIRFMTANSSLGDVMEYAALHSYSNTEVSSSVVDNFHASFPNTTILTTEFCAGQRKGALLGSWTVAEFYASHMIDELNHYTSGWIDWNMVLNPEGGPFFSEVAVSAMIIVDDEKKGFYKQPSYYAMGHLSKFVPRGSVKIGLCSVFPTGLQYSAVERPDGYTVVILFNQSNNTISTTIVDNEKANVRVTLTPNSINTIVY